MKINLIPDLVQPVISCSQNDTTLRKWEFQLYNGKTLYTPTGSCSLICSNGVEISLAQSGSLLYCDCTQELSENSGYFDCKIKIEDGDEILHSQLFKLKVEVKP